MTGAPAPEPEVGYRPVSLLEPLRAARRSRIALLVVLFTSVEGAALLGGLTLPPQAIEAGAAVALAGAATAAYGLSVAACSQLVGRLSAPGNLPAW